MAKSPAKISDLQADALRERFSLSRTYAFELAKGQKRPSLELAVKIEREFGVPVEAWLDGPQSSAA